MAIDRWEPLRDILSWQATMDRLAKVSATRAVVPMSRSATLPVDISESEDDYIVRASVPGIDPDGIEISLHSNTLTLRVARGGEHEQEGRRWLLRERRQGAAQRTITFPTPVMPNACDPAYEHGILTLTLPKSDEARPERILISNQRETHRAGRPLTSEPVGSRAAAAPRDPT